MKFLLLIHFEAYTEAVNYWKYYQITNSKNNEENDTLIHTIQ